MQELSIYQCIKDSSIEDISNILQKIDINKAFVTYPIMCCTPLVAAIQSGKSEIVTMALERGADPNQRLKLASFFSELKDGYLFLTRQRLKKSEYKQLQKVFESSIGLTPLLFAISQKASREIIKVL